jgi:hypothetical protein
MCSGVSFYGLKCTKTHVRASVVYKKKFRLANARDWGRGRGTGGGGEVKGRGEEGRREGLDPPHSIKFSYAPVNY